MSKRWIYMSKGKEGSSLKKLAAGSLTFVKAYSNGQANSAIDVLEQELETEIERDRQKVPDTPIARLRHKGGKILHGKHMLLLVVVLNIIDCALVLGELVLDLHHVKDILSHSQKTSSVFLHRLHVNYPDSVVYTDMNDLKRIYEQILRAKIDWDMTDTEDSSTVLPYMDTNTTQAGPNSTHDGTPQNGSLTFDTSQTHSRVKRSAGGSPSCDFPVSVSGLSHSVSIEERVANALHKTSLFIVCVLIVETLLKMFCFGKQFFEHKLEVFDAFIVLISFIVDLIFLEGLSAYSLQDFVYILAFILPWGVIRVVNSLVVVVRDHEHFRLKLLYTQKKKVDSDNKHLRQEKDKLSEQVDSLRRLCLGEGVDDFRIQQSMTRSSSRPGKGIMGSFASLAMGAIGGGKSNGTSFWNLLNTPKLKRGKSEEWEGKLGVSKVDSQSMRFSERLWTVSGAPEMKKPKKSQSLTQQGTTESEPGTPPTMRGRLKALKRFLRRQETVDSYSSTETIDKTSRFSLDRLSSSDNMTPLQSVDIESVTDIDTGDEAPGRMSLSPYDVINECMEDKLEESSIVGYIDSGDVAQELSSPTNVTVTTCSTDKCDTRTFSTGGSKDPIKNRTFDGRTMKIAVDIEHSDSEVIPMLLQEPEVPPAVPVSPPSLPSDHQQIRIPRGTVSTHVGHLPGLDCGHHSHSYNCIPSTTKHKHSDVPQNNNTDKNFTPRVSRNRSMPSNSTSGEPGSPSSIAMQPHPVKPYSFNPDMRPSPETAIQPKTPQHNLNSPNLSQRTHPLHPSNRTPLPNTTVPVVHQNKQINNSGGAFYTGTDMHHLPNTSSASDSSPLPGTVNSASRTPSPTADRSPSLSNNIPGTAKRTPPPDITCSTARNETSQRAENKSSALDSYMPSVNSNKTTAASEERATFYLLNTDRTPSPDNNRRSSQNRRPRSTPSRSPSVNRSPPSRSPSVNRSPPSRSPSVNRSPPSRSPSVNRSPSPAGFVSVHTSNSDVTSGFQAIQIPETHLDSTHLPPKHLIREPPTNLNTQQSSSSSSGQIQQSFSDSPGPGKDIQCSTSYLVHDNCPSQQVLRNKNNSYHYPTKETPSAHHAFNSHKQLELSDAINERITDMSQKRLDQFPASLPPDLALQRRSSMH